MEYLEYALILAIPVKLLVDVYKRIVFNTYIESVVSPYYISIVVGIFLSYFFVPDVQIIEKILIGVIAGAFPAPIVHDILEIVREMKYNIRGRNN